MKKKMLLFALLLLNLSVFAENVILNENDLYIFADTKKLFTGNTTVILNEGYKYVGDLKKGLRHGEGKEFDPKGKLVCEGTYKQGELVEGTFYYSDGKYIGKFKNGVKNGEGKQFDKKGNQFYTYLEGTKADHFAHAANYDEVASAILGSKEYKKYYFEKLTHMQKIIESGKEAKELYLEKDKDLIGFWHVIKDWQNKNLENIDVLKEEKEKLRTIIETIDLGILVISSNDKIMSYNSEAKYLFFNNSEGTRYFEKLKCTEIISFIQKSMKLTEDITEEIHLRESGKYFIAKSKYLNDHSKFIFTFRDVTHIREKSKLEKKFITNISHELKTPLTNIKGYMVAVKDEKDDELRGNFINIINRNVEKIEGLTRKNWLG